MGPFLDVFKVSGVARWPDIQLGRCGSSVCNLLGLSCLQPLLDGMQLVQRKLHVGVRDDALVMPSVQFDGKSCGAFEHQISALFIAGIGVPVKSVVIA